jgi:peptide/nickel transport system ATP-binding protein/oligopeptide transport system ATP-binding protein
MIHSEGWGNEALRMAPILEVQDLHVSYSSFGGGSYPGLAGVSFELMPNEILGVLGESGSGKSTLASSILKLLPSNGNISQGSALFEGRDLLRASPSELEQIRGKRISLVYQEPSVALHPTIRASEQIFLVLAAHESAGKSTLRIKTRQVLASLFPKEADRISNSYPHQLSGGQRQRILIAQAIACGPSLLIADEPTASLDPTTQREILGVFQRLRNDLGLAMIFITHNPILLAGFADRVLVLYGGRVAELGPARTVLSSPKHPYTRALFQSMPQIFADSGKSHKTQLPVIAGDFSAAQVPREGCVFEPRCPEKMEDCRKREPALVKLSQTHTVSCFKYGG